MITVIKECEIQIDEQPSGVIIRINGAEGCLLRICRIPKELIYDEQGNIKEFIDIRYSK